MVEVGHPQSKWEVTQGGDQQIESMDFAPVLPHELTQLPFTNWLSPSPHLVISQFLLFCECAQNEVLYDLSILAL